MIKSRSAATAVIAIVSLSCHASSRAAAMPAAGERHEKAPASGNYLLVHQGHDHIHATGVVNSVDTAHRKVNISHGPISQVGWPAMTMDYAVALSVDLKSISPGAKVEFTLEKGADGIFQVESLRPVAEGK